jgi:hypothetical protein
VVGKAPKAGGAFDRAEERVRRQAAEIEVRLERPEEVRAQGVRGDI